tara:strand:- start:28011 stop:28154 length:144 start_codon:yes stop_codon:yes gene_type:complete
MGQRKYTRDADGKRISLSKLVDKETKEKPKKKAPAKKKKAPAKKGKK